MRILLVAAALAATMPAVADDGFEYSEYRAFRRAAADIDLSRTRLALQLWRCNAAASKGLGRRAGLAAVGRSIESEAKEAMASCSAEADALARGAPAKQVAAIKEVIERLNAKIIMATRTPSTIDCATAHPCGVKLKAR